MNQVRQRKELPWPRNLVSALLFESRPSVTDAQMKALDYALSCLNKASGIDPDSETVLRMLYQEKLLAKEVAERLGKPIGRITVIREHAEEMLRHPFFDEMIRNGIDEIPSVRHDLYAYDIPLSCIRAMRNARLYTIEQLARTPAHQLNCIPHFGIVHIAETEHVLSLHNITLPEHPADCYLQEWQLAIRMKGARLLAHPWELTERHRQAFDAVFVGFTSKQQEILLLRHRDQHTWNEITEIMKQNHPEENYTDTIISKLNSQAELRLRDPRIQHMLVTGQEA